jgi:hypothetical protein
MRLAAIDRELGLLQSELESLQGGFDSKRFLGASVGDFETTLEAVAKQQGWVLSKAGGESIYFLHHSDRGVFIQIGRSVTLSGYASITNTNSVETYTNTATFKAALESGIITITSTGW